MLQSGSPPHGSVSSVQLLSTYSFVAPPDDLKLSKVSFSHEGAHWADVVGTIMANTNAKAMKFMSTPTAFEKV
jgi:hypothetical protein